MKRKKVGIFIDHENIFYQLRDTVGSDVRMNYKSLLDFASRFGFEIPLSLLYIIGGLILFLIGLLIAFFLFQEPQIIIY
jgi:hypothetical protein